MNTFNDNDYFKIVEEFEKINLRQCGIAEVDLLSWIYFMADIYMLEYYYSKYKNMTKCRKTCDSKYEDSIHLSRIKIKYTDIYCRIIKQHHHYYEKLISKFYKLEYKFSGFLEDEYFLYDIMTLNEEIILYDLLALNAVNVKMHEKLVFCYKYFIEGWSSKVILDKLRKRSLCKVFIDFINEYSKQSGLPQVVVLCYFYPLEEELYKTKKELAKINQYFTSIDVLAFLSKDRAEKRLFINNTIVKRINLIDKWCNRLREKIINNTIDFLKSDNL